jgi:cystine transport system ATP-binding protein
MSPTDATPQGSQGSSSQGSSPQGSSPSSQGDAALLTVRGLRKSFGANEVLKSIDVTVGRGQVVALIGPSGSGKTTVLRSLNGLEVPDSGTVHFDGYAPVDFATKPSRRELVALRDRSAMVFQQFNLFPHRTVLQNVIEGPVQVQKVPVAEATAAALKLLDRVGLADKRDAYPFELSGGQQQRVGIVRALAQGPDLLLFDEPTSSLDPELVGDVLEVIRELASEGWTMVLVTHELQFAKHVADQVVFMDGGVVVEAGPPSEVLVNPQHDRTKQFLHRLLDR